MRRRQLLDDLAQDFRISLRTLLRAPAMTLTIVATVGLGIGATTAIFSAIDAGLIRPLPYAQPDTLVRLFTDSPPNWYRFSMVDYLALDAEQTRFAQIAGYLDSPKAFSDGVTAERVRGREVTWTYFGLLGITPAIGRDFTAEDGRAGSPRAVIVSDAFWHRRLGARLDVVGTPVRLDAADYRVAGVLPPAAGPLEQNQDFFIAAQWAPPQRKGPFMITALARLRSTSDWAAATGELHAINRRLFPLWRASYQDERATWNMMSLKQYVTGDVSAIAGLASAAVGLVWLIACANASNLLVARVTSRRRELSVRAALGASRGRVVRYLLAESFLLAAAASLVGVALAAGGVSLLREFAAGYFPRTHEMSLDRTALALLGALSAVSALLFGLVPAVHGTGGSVDESLRSAGRSSTASASAKRLRRVLVGIQFAIATPLLVVAGLFLATLNALGRVDLGFDTRNLVSGGVSLPAAQYRDPARVSAFFDEFRHRLEGVAGVSAVAFANGRPPNDVADFNNFDLEDFPAGPGRPQPVTPWISVTPEYFHLLGLQLLEGRLLDERDALPPSVLAVVVDRSWAKRFFPTGSAIGKRLQSGGCTTCPWTTVVGVVSDVKYAGLEKPDTGSVYYPMEPGTRLRYVMIRSTAGPSAVVPAVQEALHALDPNLPLSNIATIDELAARSLQRPRSLSWLVGVLATVALALSMVGIYGVMAYYVQQHAKDISIRLALGAGRRDVLRHVVGEGMAVVVAGLAAGLLIASVVTRLIASLLFDVGAADPPTFLGVALVLLLVGLGASLLPARRAAGLEPAAVLRSE